MPLAGSAFLGHHEETPAAWGDRRARRPRPMPAASFARALFFGEIAESSLFPYPQIERAEQARVARLLADLRERLEPRANDLGEASAPRAEPTLRDLADLGVLGLTASAAHGGLGLSTPAAARVVSEIASYAPGLALGLVVHVWLATAAVERFGTDAQRARLLPALASGEALGAFALTEAGAGSDAGGVRTYARPRPAGDGGGYVLRGAKTWVTNAADADVVVVFARTTPPEDGSKPKLTAFVLPRDERFVLEPIEGRVGLHGVSIEGLRLEDVEASDATRLGEVGKGFLVATESLTRARVGVAAVCTGIARRLVRLTVERAEERKAFGRSLAELGLVRDKIARMSADLYALESVTYLAASLADDPSPDVAVESALAKVLGSEVAVRIAHEASLVAAASGYAASSWERLGRDARGLLFAGGTNEILRCFVALTGMQGPAEERNEVARAMREPIKGFGLLGDLALRRARDLLGRERLSRAHPALAAEAARVEEAVPVFARHVERALRRHGKLVAEMQFTQHRVAECALDLFALSAVIARTTRALELRGEEGARRELDLARAFAAMAGRRLSGHLASFDQNEDDLRKDIAARAAADNGYPLDVV